MTKFQITSKMHFRGKSGRIEVATSHRDICTDKLKRVERKGFFGPMVEVSSRHYSTVFLMQHPKDSVTVKKLGSCTRPRPVPRRKKNAAGRRRLAK